MLKFSFFISFIIYLILLFFIGFQVECANETLSFWFSLFFYVLLLPNYALLFTFLLIVLFSCCFENSIAIEPIDWNKESKFAPAF